jgi:hypothetical protein
MIIDNHSNDGLIDQLRISKHEKGLKAWYMHFFLITNHLIFGLLPAIPGVLLFFVKNLPFLSQGYIQLASYYLNLLRRETWLGMRSVNYPFKQLM